MFAPCVYDDDDIFEIICEIYAFHSAAWLDAMPRRGILGALLITAVLYGVQQ